MASPHPRTSTGRAGEITASSDVQALRGWDHLTRLCTYRHIYRYRWCDKCTCTDGVDHPIRKYSALTAIRPADADGAQQILHQACADGSAQNKKKMECTNGVYIAVDVGSARSDMPYIETTPRWAARSDRWELYFYNAN